MLLPDDSIDMREHELHFHTASNYDNPSLLVKPLSELTENEGDCRNTILLSCVYKEKIKELVRPCDGLISTTVNRLAKIFDLKIKKARISRMEDNSSIDFIDYEKIQMKNFDAKNDMQIHLSTSIVLSIKLNPPKILSLKTFPTSLLIVGCIIHATATYQFADGMDIVWFREVSQGSRVYSPIFSGPSFTPSLAEVGCRLKVYCTPWSKADDKYQRGRTVSYTLPGFVEGRPTVFNKMVSFRRQFSDRICLEKQLKDKLNFRCCSYNILSETYSTSKQAAKTYSYTSKENLFIEFRMQRVLDELLFYQADIVCLQECDDKTFHSYLAPILSSADHRYVAHYANKDSGVTEGCACFVREDNLEVVRVLHLSLKAVLRSAGYLEGFYRLRPDLKDIIGGKLGMICQILICRSKAPGQTAGFLVLANTHLFYHPAAGYLRLLQMHAITSALERIVALLRRGKEPSEIDLDLEVTGQEDSSADLAIRLEDLDLKGSHPLSEPPLLEKVKVSVVICGDLNSTPNAAVVEFLSRLIIR